MDTQMIDVDKLEAGVELDDRIAERVFGWCVEQFTYGGMEKDRNEKCTVWVTDPSRALEAPRKRVDITKNRIPFSTDIAAAWQVLDHLISLHPKWRFWVGKSADLPEEDIEPYWECYIQDYESTPTNPYRGYADDCDTAPLAICRAALKAVLT